MKQIELQQGSAEWHAHRLSHFNASDAPAMMGDSKYKTRAELLRELATGETEEISERQQMLFDRGHAAEAAIRPHIEELIGEDLYPAVGVSERFPRLSASFDGLTMSDHINFEHKLWNEDLAEAVRRCELPIGNAWQCEQQMLVSGATRTVFVVSDGTPERMVWMDYSPVEGRAAQLVDGWVQFEKDLVAWKPAPVVVEAVGRAPDSLPTLHIDLTGMVRASNLPEFQQRAIAVFQGIRTDLATDQDFADAAKTVSWCEEIEGKLDAAKAHALAQTSSIEELFRAIDAIKEEARNKRLELTKLVNARKHQVRDEIQQRAKAAMVEHMSDLNCLIPTAQLPVPMMAFTADIATAMKSKKSFASMQEAVDGVVAKYKIDTNAHGQRVRANLDLMAATNEPQLFPDMTTLAHSKSPEDLRNLIETRVAARVRAEQLRIDAERATIRAEEEAKAQAEAERLAEQERQRIRQEEQAKAQAEQASMARSVPDTTPTAPQAASNDPQPEAPETPAAVAVFDEAQQPPVAAVRPGATMRLGDINARIAPISISGTALAQLGFQPMDVGGTAKVYDANQFQDMCRAMGRVLKAAMEAPAMEKAA